MNPIIREILNPTFCGFYAALSYLILCRTFVQLIVPNTTITQIHETGAPHLPFSCILMHADDWKLSGSLEALPHFSTWGGWLTCSGSRMVCTYCFWEETRRTLQPSTCFVKFFRIAFSSRILFLLTPFCLSVKTSVFN